RSPGPPRGRSPRRLQEATAAAPATVQPPPCLQGNRHVNCVHFIAHPGRPEAETARKPRKIPGQTPRNTPSADRYVRSPEASRSRPPARNEAPRTFPLLAMLRLPLPTAWTWTPTTKL